MLGRDDARGYDMVMSCRVRNALEPFRVAQIRPRPDWNQIQDACMIYLLRKKFEHAHFRIPLLATEDALLIYRSRGDMYWGCTEEYGQNRLGQMLMQVRSEIREEIRTTQAGAFLNSLEIPSSLIKA